jgi:hypothetical protein
MQLACPANRQSLEAIGIATEELLVSEQSQVLGKVACESLTWVVHTCRKGLLLVFP